MIDRELTDMLACSEAAKRPSDIASDGRGQDLLDHLAATRASIEKLEAAVRRAPSGAA